MAKRLAQEFCLDRKSIKDEEEPGRAVTATDVATVCDIAEDE